MKRTLLIGGVALAFFFAGCSKQPTLQNATETNQTATQTQTTENQTAANTAESVNTENAKVEEQNLQGMNVSVTQNNQQFAKKLASIVIYFDFDKYNIRPDQWPKVEELAKLIKENPSNYTVRIEGNCDEWGTEEYNYALGLKRANSVKNALIKLGVDPKKLTVISYGELNPVCTAHAKWCWRKNRRDNFTYLP
ncbi:OmpA family protein [Caminibacter pacificus]|uniref:Peptidoglycan-associated lipoprotein n=1 Tax=Caminibacter pacificus TaxID=1424653 RepID=A0AAJ4UXQ3_9BACT|nr:OmpA family protein [Caminibacter pacificus]QCI27904.1 flagellar motor protein MotB [Caminibacter pacificus]ROR39918.1 peptidoglycan-associated lipoprotein [Caminibacter pacificus]